MNPALLRSLTLAAQPRGGQIAGILAAALGAVDPAQAVRRFLVCSDDVLQIGERAYKLANVRRICALAFGKAGAPMLAAAQEILAKRLDRGLAVVKAGHAGDPAPAGGSAAITIYEAGHPVPDTRGVEATGRALALLADLDERDLVLVLISGGGSALLTQPAPGISLDDLQALTRLLLASGATINEINTLRKHLDLVKGGGLARFAGGAQIAALVLSDVIGDPLDVIASGPTVADTTSFADAYAVLEHYQLLERAPAPIVARLQRGMQGHEPDTPKAGDPLLARVQNIVIGSNRQAAEAALQAAREAGFHTLLLTTSLQGEAREAGRMLAAIAAEVHASGQPVPRPCCIVVGGETTVTLRGDGRGGRNQELALAAVTPLAGLARTLLVTLATDGDDGPTDAAGAVVTGETLRQAAAQGLDPASFLARNDAYSFFDALGDLLRPGPTLTNVNDLAFIFVDNDEEPAAPGVDQATG
jgi:hydroxypyruvate reductase